jgi:amino acid transporter
LTVYTLHATLIIEDWRENAFKDFLVGGTWGRLSAFWLCCTQAAFAHTGSEIIGITANEVNRPRQVLPRAVRRISKRLIFCYVGAAFVLGLNLSANDPQLGWYLSNPKGSYQGPFVLMMQRAGLPVLGHIINAVVIIACLSVANANLYNTVEPVI